MNCARDFIITREHNSNLWVWCGRDGWAFVLKDIPFRINDGYKYKTEKHAIASIKRHKRSSNYQWWKDAMYCTIDEATSDDNPLGLKWRK